MKNFIGFDEHGHCISLDIGFWWLDFFCCILLDFIGFWQILMDFEVFMDYKNGVHLILMNFNGIDVFSCNFVYNNKVRFHPDSSHNSKKKLRTI